MDPASSTPLMTAARSLPYSPDAAALFHRLATAQDSLLLEAADIESKKNLNCIAVLRAALRVRCQGQEVTVTALTAVGEVLLAQLSTELAEYLQPAASAAPSHRVFEFERSTAADERTRLKATSTAAVLRALYQDRSYSSAWLPFIGGGFAFDYVETFEQCPPVAEGVNTYPDYEFVVAEYLLHVDHLHRTARVEAVGLSAAGLAEELDQMAAAAQQLPEVPQPVSRETLTAVADSDDPSFRDRVSQLQKNIDAGDIYQVVPARTFSVECPDAFAAYRQLRESNPSPYMFYVRGQDYELFGASPESNLKFDAASRQLQLYPIAGTRPRGATHELDIRNELAMRTDAKEVAEHTMLVDLARNDLARVAVPGTRQVAELLQVDRYSRVMHLVSRVVAELDPDFDALDAYRACMNMGTLTGAPKLRAIELIRDSEHTRRGSYGGAVGYIRGDGSMDNCIVIRSAFVRDGVAHVQAGAGVVRDSTPQAEADETLHKAYAVLHAIATAHHAQLEVIR